MKQDVRRLQVTMNDFFLLYVAQSSGYLANDKSCLLLLQSLSLLEQSLQVKAIGIILDHVDFILSLDRLVQADAVLAIHHAVHLHLPHDHVELLILEELVFVDLAREDLFGLIDVGRDDWVSFLMVTLLIGEEVGGFLGFDYCAKLTLANDLVVKDYKVVDQTRP